MAKQSLENKVFVITGASSGIGQAVALALAERGCRVALGSRRVENLEETANAVRARGGEALVISTDVTQRPQVERLFQETMDCWGRIDGLISNAGRYVRSPILELTIRDLEDSMAVNFYGHVHCIQAVLPVMIQQGSGHILLIASMDAKKGIPPDAPYVAAKFALSGFGDVLRQEVRDQGIAVTTVYPGRVDTPMIADLHVPTISKKMPVESAARAIVRAVDTRPAELILPAQAFYLNLLNVFSPRLADWYVRVSKLGGW